MRSRHHCNVGEAQRETPVVPFRASCWWNTTRQREHGKIIMNSSEHKFILTVGLPVYFNGSPPQLILSLVLVVVCLLACIPMKPWLDQDLNIFTQLSFIPHFSCGCCVCARVNVRVAHTLVEATTLTRHRQTATGDSGGAVVKAYSAALPTPGEPRIGARGYLQALLST